MSNDNFNSKIINLVNRIPDKSIQKYYFNKYHVCIAIRTIKTMKSKMIKDNNSNYFFIHSTELINKKLIDNAILNSSFEMDSDEKQESINAFHNFEEIKPEQFMGDFFARLIELNEKSKNNLS